MARYAMIMAGGAGTRLWPMSRRARPKQLLPLMGGRSLLEMAADRLEGLLPPERRLICTAEAFRGAIRRALPQFADEQILGEPAGRNTVNAIGLTAAVLRRRDEDAVFAVLTADHVIEPPEEFRRKADLGFALVEDDARRLVTFAITPTYPATGYGYVERGAAIPGFDGAWVASHFEEKPDEATARRYLEAGTFGWNSGMFVYQARQFLEALSWYKPGCHAGLARIAEAWDTDRRGSVLGEVYPGLEAISVDYAVMEPAASDERLAVCCVPMAVSWTDVGSWPTYGATLEADAAGCRTNARALHLGSSNVLAVSDDPGHVIATVGCRDLIIVRTGDVTMVCPASEAQRVRDLAERAGESLR